MKKEPTNNTSSLNQGTSSFFNWFNNDQSVINVGSNSTRSSNNQNLNTQNPTVSIFERACIDCFDVFQIIISSYSLKNILTLRLVSSTFYKLVSQNTNNKPSALSSKAIVCFKYLKTGKTLTKREQQKQLFTQTHYLESKIDSFCFSLSKLRKKALYLKQEIDRIANTSIIRLVINSSQELLRFYNLLLSDQISPDQQEVISKIGALDLNIYSLEDSEFDAAESFFQLIQAGTILNQITAISLTTPCDSKLCEVSHIKQLKNLHLSGDCDFGNIKFNFYELSELSLEGCNLPPVLILNYLPKLEKFYLPHNYFALTLASSNLLTIEDRKNYPPLIDTQHLEILDRETHCEIIIDKSEDLDINILLSMDDIVSRASSFQKKLDLFPKNTFFITITFNDYNELMTFCQLLTISQCQDQKLIFLKTNKLDLSSIVVNQSSLESINIFLHRLAEKDSPLLQLRSITLGKIEVDFTFPDISQITNLEFLTIRKKLILPNLIKLEHLSLGSISRSRMYSHENPRYFYSCAEFNLPNLPQLQSLRVSHNYVVLTSSSYDLKTLDMFRIEKDLDEPGPLLIIIQPDCIAHFNINSTDTQKEHSCRIDGPSTIKGLIPINEFFAQGIDYNKSFNFCSRRSLLKNVLVFDTIEKIKLFHDLLSNNGLSDYQRSILCNINKINLGLFNIDNNNIKDINRFLNFLSKIDGTLLTLESLEFGNIDASLTLPNFMQLQELLFKDINVSLTFSGFSQLKILKFSNINAELILPNIPQLQELQLDDINSNLSFPDFLMVSNFPELKFLKFRNINAKLALITLPKLKTLTFMNINVDTTLPLFPQLNKFNLRSIDSKAVLTLWSKTYDHLPSSWHNKKDKIQKSLIIKEEEKCIIS